MKARSRTTMWRFTLLTTCVVLAGCEKRLSIGAVPGALGSDGDAAPNGDGGLGQLGDGSAHVDGSAPDASVDLCARTTPRFDVGDGAGATCSDGPRRAFRNALCSCGDLQNSGPIFVDAFDSAVGAYMAGDRGGSVGVSGSMYPAPVEIGGSLWVRGPNGLPMSADVTVHHDLYVEGQLDGPFEVSVGGDARVGGNLHVATLALGGTLRVSDTTDVEITNGAPSFTRGAIDVPEPCDCSEPLDIPALVESARTNNDNALIGLDAADGLRSLNGPIELTLPCGRYYVDAFYAPNPITITVTGPVELYVKGGVVAELAGTFDVQLAKGGSLDLFVERGFSTTNRVQIGWPTAPQRTRIYAGGGDTLYFAGETTLGASFYAPQGELVTSGDFEVFGAMLVARVASSGPLTVHYDRALARDDCELATCTGKDECGTLACKSMMCAACIADADCAAPLRCDRGLCLP